MRKRMLRSSSVEPMDAASSPILSRTACSIFMLILDNDNARAQPLTRRLAGSHLAQIYCRYRPASIIKDARHASWRLRESFERQQGSDLDDPAGAQRIPIFPELKQ